MQAKLFALIGARGLGGYITHSETVASHRRKAISSIKLCAALVACTLVPAAANAQVRAGGTGPEQMAGYAVDGRVLGSRLASDSATRDYKCGPSEQFSDFIWCQRTSRERERRGGYDAISSMLRSKDGTIVYLSRHQQPGYLDAPEVERSIQKYTRQFGEPAKISKLPRRAGAPEATIAIWGKLELEPLDGDSIKLLADGKSPKKGFLLDYLGNLSRSAQDGLPIYRMRGGAGFAWAASVDARGRGTLRLVAINASALAPEPAMTTQPASAATDEPQPAYRTAAASRPEPVEAAKSTGDERAGVAGGDDAADTIARLESELSLLREQKAQAEEAARLAAADAAIARNEKAEATSAAAAAASEIARLRRARVAPSLFADREAAVPIGLAAAAILLLGAWFGTWLGARASRWRAERAASGELDTPAERAEAESPPAAMDQPAAATDEATPVIDQDGLVRELGKQLGLEEVTAPSIANPLPDNNLEPASSQPDVVALPVTAAVAREIPPVSIAEAPAQPSAAEAVATVPAIEDVRSSPQAA